MRFLLPLLLIATAYAADPPELPAEVQKAKAEMEHAALAYNAAMVRWVTDNKPNVKPIKVTEFSSDDERRKSAAADYVIEGHPLFLTVAKQWANPDGSIPTEAAGSGVTAMTAMSMVQSAFGDYIKKYNEARTVGLIKGRGR